MSDRAHPQLGSTEAPRETPDIEAVASAAARAGIQHDTAETFATLTDEQVRLKLRMAGKLWKRLYPGEVKRYLDQVRQQRAKQTDRRSGRLSSDADMRQGFVEPPMSFTGLLAMSEWQTNFRYGVPCGIGDKLWHLRERYKPIFRAEFDVGWVTDVHNSQKGID